MLSRRSRSAPLLALGLAGLLALSSAGVAHAADPIAPAPTPAVSPAPAAVSPAPAAVSPAAATVERISGADRYATSVAASQATFPGPERPEVVYLVTGRDFPDAIAAGPVATAAGGGLLLTARDQLPTVVAAELERLAPQRIVVVGGVGAISDTVLRAADAIAPAERIGGADRYATAAALVGATFADGAPTVYLATGSGFPDALAAGPAAGSIGAPIVLVRGTRPALDPATVALLSELGTTEVVIVGGTGVVSTGIEAQLAGLLGAEGVRRLGGADRYTTALAVSQDAFGANPSRIVVASGTGFADALSISVLAARQGLPIALSLPYCVPSTVRPALSAPTVASLVLVGGRGALSAGIERLQACQSIGAASSLWVLVNKRNAIPTSYVPAGMRQPSIPNIGGQLLRAEAATALERMAAGVQAAGVGRIGIASGYRSGATQAAIYSNGVRNSGQAYTDLYVARPGHSEHQTGLAADIYPIGAANCSSIGCLGATPQGRWLAQNSWRYGFILRYEQGMTAVTGYAHESWHFRFIGTTLAADYASSGHRTYESFLGQPPAPRY